ncbi:MAG: type II toxin-antitoxin system Phd/YefM family antitoxin [Proteobacteria bacterium]|nr:type II toxin-antitoxin system Phd/YefM family antitoxin [Pseudomonadota bacterium]
MQVNIHEAKSHLSRLLARVAQGEEVVIARSGRPIARLVPIEAARQRVAGRYAGEGYVADDFDAPLRDFEDEFYAS